MNSRCRKTLFATFFVIGVITVQSSGLADSQQSCPRLEGINLKCMIPNPPGTPPPSGLVCPVEERPARCTYYSSGGTISRAVSGSVCENWSCDVENSPEGLPRYRTQCTSRRSCCDVQEVACASAKSVGEGVMKIGADCSVSVSCPGVPGMSSGGEDMPDCSASSTTCADLGGGSSCGSGGSEAPSCGP